MRKAPKTVSFQRFLVGAPDRISPLIGTPLALRAARLVSLCSAAANRPLGDSENAVRSRRDAALSLASLAAPGAFASFSLALAALGYALQILLKQTGQQKRGRLAYFPLKCVGKIDILRRSAQPQKVGSKQSA